MLFRSAWAIVFVLALVAVVIPFDAKSCHATWDHSGYGVRYSAIGGCQIQLKDGSWIPAAALRGVKEAK